LVHVRGSPAPMDLVVSGNEFVGPLEVNTSNGPYNPGLKKDKLLDPDGKVKAEVLQRMLERRRELLLGNAIARKAGANKKVEMLPRKRFTKWRPDGSMHLMARIFFPSVLFCGA